MTFLDPATRAIDVWNLIVGLGTSVVFRTPDGATLPAQVVRLEYDNSASEAESASGASAVRKLTVYGVRDHPRVDVPDTDIARGYRFVRESREYEVQSLVLHPGEVQARAEAVG